MHVVEVCVSPVVFTLTRSDQLQLRGGKNMYSHNNDTQTHTIENSSCQLEEIERERNNQNCPMQAPAR